MRTGTHSSHDTPRTLGVSGKAPKGRDKLAQGAWPWASLSRALGPYGTRTGSTAPQNSGYVMFETHLRTQTQRQIVAETEAEQPLVATNREPITRFEKKIQPSIARISGDEESAQDPA